MEQTNLIWCVEKYREGWKCRFFDTKLSNYNINEVNILGLYFDDFYSVYVEAPCSASALTLGKMLIASFVHEQRTLRLYKVTLHKNGDIETVNAIDELISDTVKAIKAVDGLIFTNIPYQPGDTVVYVANYDMDHARHQAMRIIAERLQS